MEIDKRPRQYLCIDLKSFFASVECVERGLDPMTTNLVVADPDRTDKTICLAITPAMKALGIRNRCRVFEIPRHVQYITAPPRMQKYIDYAAEIYAVYLKYVAPEDIHVYSIDEVFMDVTAYLGTYRKTARELAQTIMADVLSTVGIRATCGIGTNLYLAKIALDITAKHAPDFIGELDEESYRETMWSHTPLTDFWRIGPGIAKTLARHGVFTMEGIARMPEEHLYTWFGVDAELLIDHAWGREPTTIADIKSYKTRSNCLTSGQVLMRDYGFEEGELIVREMTDQLCLDMASKGAVTHSITLHVGYSNALHLPPAHGTASIATDTHSPHLILPAVKALYRRIVDPALPVRRINITCNQIVSADTVSEQMTVFDTPVMQEADPDTARERRDETIQSVMLDIKRKYGKNAIVKGMNLEKSATGMERNRQIGGHKSGEE